MNCVECVSAGTIITVGLAMVIVGGILVGRGLMYKAATERDKPK